jgi:hypothetical protein
MGTLVSIVLRVLMVLGHYAATVPLRVTRARPKPLTCVTLRVTVNRVSHDPKGD